MMLAVFRPGAFLFLVGLAALVFSIVAIVDMARHPSWQWQRAGSNKALWLVLQILSVLLLYPVAIVIGVLYYAVARPKLLAVENQGPGPGYWAPTAAPPVPGGWANPVPGPGPQAEPQTWAAGSAPPQYPGSQYGVVPTPEPTQPQPPTTQPPAQAPPTTQPPTQSAPTQSAPPFGWYADPSSRHELRYWDGTRWTEHVTDAGQQSTDPLPT